MPQNINDKLKQRGIYDAALKAGWETDGNGWKYPICDLDGNIISYRWKNADSDAKPKYRWPTGKPRDHMEANYYIPPNVNLRQEIHNADGVLYIASGEPDVLAYHAAGIYNTLSGFGEGNIPISFADDLQKMAVKEVRYFLDRDDTGDKSGQKVLGKLAGTGIAAHIYRLPEYLGEGGDINRLWMNVAFDAEEFHRILEHIASDLDLMVILDCAPSAPQSRTWSGTLPDDFLRDLELQLQLHGVERYDTEGWSNAVQCLFNEQHEHDHRRPAAHWNHNTHCFYCHKCGQSWNAKETGAQLGLDIDDYRDHRPKTKQHHPLQQIPDTSESTSKTLDFLSQAQQAGLSISDDDLKNLTDDKIGDFTARAWEVPTAFFRGQWHQYTDGVWKPITTEQLDQDIWSMYKVLKPLGVRPTQTRVNSVRAYLKSHYEVPNNKIDAATGHLNLRNGHYNLETYQLEPHDPEQYFTTQIPITFDPEAECPTWLACLDDWLSDDDAQKQLLQEAFGYSLTLDTKYEKAFWLYGEAATGKSTLLRVLEVLLGDGYTGFDLSALRNGPKYSLASIAGKRVAVCTELAANTILADNSVKQIISGETIQVRQIYGKPFTAKMTTKLWLAANELPTNLDRSGAIYRRIIIIPFNRVIPATERDPNLFGRLRQEISGIFNWALAGLQSLEARGRFEISQSMLEAVDAYRQQNDIEATFINEWCIVDPNASVKAADLYMAYKGYCEIFGETYKSRNKVAEDWKRLSYDKKRLRDGNYYLGIELTKEAQDYVERQRRQKGLDHPGR